MLKQQCQDLSVLELLSLDTSYMIDYELLSQSRE